MSNINRIAQKVIAVSQQHGPTAEYHKYYLREEMPTEKYISEGLVVMAPEPTGADMLFAMMLTEVDPNPALEYYHAILAANLPTRAQANEARFNHPLDKAGILEAAEYRMAAEKAAISVSPLVAAMLYREQAGTDLLVELMSLTPLRPSIGLERFQARIRQKLVGLN